MVLAELKRRGVLLIEIDAGARPERTVSRGMLSRLRQPVAGYTRGVFAAPLRAVDENVRSLESIIGSDRFRHQRISFTPKDETVEQIMTALWLPPNDIARIERPLREYEEANGVEFAEFINELSSE